METKTPPILVFLVAFPAIYLLSYHTIFKHWPRNLRPEAASCAISFLHGTPAFLLSSFTLRNSFAAANTAIENTLLDFSLSYFATDLAHYLTFYPTDAAFVGHHLATLFVLSTCRYYTNHGAPAVLLLLAVAESTSFLQNTWTLASARRLHHPLAASLYKALRLPFYAVYTLARGVVGPFILYRMMLFFCGGGAQGVISAWVWVSWIAVVSLAVAGSLLWVSTLWAELFREIKASSTSRNRKQL